VWIDDGADTTAVGVPLMPFFTRRTGPAPFRLRWRGYDRAEVDEFLRQTAADRQRLQEDLAQLETVRGSYGDQRQRELERLAALRTEVAGCLEASIGALRTATERLASTAHDGPGLPEAAHQSPIDPPGWLHLLKQPAFRTSALAWVSGGRRLLIAAAVFAAALLLFVLLDRDPPRAAEMSVARVAASQDFFQPAPPPEPVIQQIEGLLLTVTALESCWLRTSIDGGQSLERLLKPDETIMLRASQEASLRVGNAAALSLLINNQPAKPLGRAGQVVTARITRSNYLEFLANN
jgi:DivIVA domain-containing protein